MLGCIDAGEVGNGEGLNLRQRERRLCLSDDAAPAKGAVIFWRQSDVTSFGVMTGVITLYAKEATRLAIIMLITLN